MRGAEWPQVEHGRCLKSKLLPLTSQQPPPPLLLLLLLLLGDLAAWKARANRGP